MSNKNNNDQNNRNEYFEDRAGTDEARYHVVPNDEKGWAVKEEGNDDPVYTADSKSDAVKEAKQRAEKSGTMAYVHSEHGQIEEQHNYKDE
ncbi:DUF2188 domain-containing protein [Rossellomorea vietnamensis]|uniref:DUF2188 domain-containing protein n=1 Tax=Rossellomorea vietnamensis TaxID=218284 RepID=A0A5D4MGR0_9BACI|nr:DUF2188 domain-containing protein [Rossellomorea vietnamensis]TYS00246.1 DUF2188 domain-containing protein [Rossellomorea vietnamensis]